MRILWAAENALIGLLLVVTVLTLRFPAAGSEIDASQLDVVLAGQFRCLAGEPTLLDPRGLEVRRRGVRL